MYWRPPARESFRSVGRNYRIIRKRFMGLRATRPPLHLRAVDVIAALLTTRAGVLWESSEIFLSAAPDKSGCQLVRKCEGVPFHADIDIFRLNAGKLSADFYHPVAPA